MNLFDPGVLVDDDGSVYMYTGFAPLPGWMKLVMNLRGLKIDAGYCIRLDKDMITMKGEPVMVLPGPAMTSGTRQRKLPSDGEIRNTDNTGRLFPVPHPARTCAYLPFRFSHPGLHGK